jgi:hypothetical protein
MGEQKSRKFALYSHGGLVTEFDVSVSFSSKLVNSIPPQLLHTSHHEDYRNVRGGLKKDIAMKKVCQKA